jgi:hypothetical protein
MKKLSVTTVLLAAMFLGAQPVAAGDMYFQEDLTVNESVRYTRDGDSTGSVRWLESGPGQPSFGQPLLELSYAHSIDGIDPAVIPDGTVLQMRLKIYVKSSDKKEIELTVDSLNLRNVNRRHFLVGPQIEDSVVVEQSNWGEGAVVVSLVSSSGKTFEVRRSVLDMYYRPPVATAVEDPTAALPGHFRLKGNYPNPFNPSTVIEYGLTASAHVTIEIFNVGGKRVRSSGTLRQSAGEHSYVWDGRDQQGRAVSSGVYLYRVSSAGDTQVRRMLLLK